jgi:hypothetical protein
MSKEEEFNYISEDDYKTLISIYQQKTFELFNQNIALEAKITNLNKLVEKLTDNINKIAKTNERVSKRKVKPQQNNLEKESILEEETFN